MFASLRGFDSVTFVRQWLNTFLPLCHFTVNSILKGDKVTRKENTAADSQSDSQSSVSDSPSAHPPPPPLHRSQELPRKPLEPFHLHSFPKVGNTWINTVPTV